MLFGIDDGTEVVHVAKNGENGRYNDGYVFRPVITCSEQEMFNDFRRRKYAKESKDRLFHMTNPTFSSPNSIFGGAVSNSKVESCASMSTFPNSGGYIIPKLFGYFPFLDCDSEDTYHEAKYQLCSDGIPFMSYNSTPSKDSYWIFCDIQGTFEDTISFIECYPCDYRYPWIARMKGEMCVRALPRSSGVPTIHDTFAGSKHSEDFSFFMQKFDKYWKEGLVIKYIDMMNVANSI